MLNWCWEHPDWYWVCAQAGQMNAPLLEWHKRSSTLRQRQRLHSKTPVPSNDPWLPLIKLKLLYGNRRVMLPWHTMCCTTEMWSTYSCLERTPAFAHSCQIWDESLGLRGILGVVSLCHFLKRLQEDTLYFPLKCCWQRICIVFSHARIPRVSTVREEK